MADRSARPDHRGPFRASQLGDDDRYELSNGHAIYCAPVGGQGARATGTAFEVLDTDPAVEEAGVDPGYSPEPGVLRAPDVGVGNVPNAPGWIAGAPPLAVEYADTGQDEADLQGKIVDLFAAGTRFLWVVRLVGPRRVEVHERGKPMQVVGPGALLTAPGVLKNAVPAEALWDRSVAHEVVLRNILERKGYPSLDAVREEGREAGLEQGRLEALREAIVELCEVLGVEWSAERARAVSEMSRAQLDEVRATLRSARRWP